MWFPGSLQDVMCCFEDLFSFLDGESLSSAISLAEEKPSISAPLLFLLFTFEQPLHACTTNACFKEAFTKSKLFTFVLSTLSGAEPVRAMQV